MQNALGRFLPVFVQGMTGEDAKKAESIYRELFSFSLTGLGRDSFLEAIEEKVREAGSLPPDGRKRILEEDSLALGVERLDRVIREAALGVHRGAISATPAVKKEVRRASARLGQLNAVIVGRFPHLAPLLEKISESYLDTMFVLGDGKGILSMRLRKAAEAPGSRAGGPQPADARAEASARFPAQPLSPPPPKSGAMKGQAMKREVKCGRCGWWWHHPAEPIHFASWDEWAEDHPEKESLTCPNCGAVTDVSEGNVRFSRHIAGRKGAQKKTGGKRGK